MRITIRFSLPLCIILLGLGSPAQADEWRLGLCYGKDATSIDQKYRRAIADVAARTFSSVDSNSNVTVKIRDCVEEPDLACYADSEAIFCREEPLALAIRISAWLSAEAAFIYVSSEDTRLALEHAPKLSWADALRLADAESDEGAERFTRYGDIIIENKDLSAESLNSIYALVTDLYLHTNNDTTVDMNNLPLQVALEIYGRVNDYVFAFILGHEAYHYNKNRCPITGQLPIERNGYWKEIYQLQLENGLFDPRVSLEKHELTADLCGFRWMALRAKNHQGDQVLGALARRVAIDVLAAPIFAGLLNVYAANSKGQEVPVLKLTDGYLYPQSRLVLAALTLNSAEPVYPSTVKICNDTSKALVTSVQESVQGYSKTSGIIPDSFLAAIAPGVEVAWNGGAWSDESHSCKAGIAK